MLEKKSNNFLAHARVGHKKLVRRQAPAAPSATDCSAGGLYVSPAAGDVVDSSVKTLVTWNRACLASDVKNIDIYVYAPQLSNATTPFQRYTGVPVSQKDYKIKLEPRWWVNDVHQDKNASFSFNIVPAGNEPWDSANPMGPTWTAQYIVPANGKIPADAERDPSLKQKLVSAFVEDGKLNASGKTAAIVCPIIVVVCVVALLVRRLHIKRNNKTVDWAEQMDKRMSRISVDWQQGGDGSAGPIPGTRPASYMARVSHDVGGGNMAGRGAGNRVPREMSEVSPAFATEGEMREARPRGMSMYDEGNRSSRISFAGNTRGDRISKISFANSSEAHGGLRGGLGGNAGAHRSSASLPRLGQNGNRRSQMQTESYYDPDAPAVPQLDERFRSSHDTRRESRFSDGLVYADDDEDDDEILMSPTQNDGPMPLGHGDVDRMRKSLDAGRSLGAPSSSSPSSSRPESDGRDMFGSNGARPDSSISDAGRYIDHAHYNGSGSSGPALAPDHPNFASSVARQPSPAVSSQTGMAPPVNFSSPDEAMKHYASLRAAAGSAAAETQAPTSMRSLYTPDALPGHRTQASVAGSSLNEDDVVGYNEMLDHGHSR
ncbi:uncharacterized protein PSFLO_06847 [Pseudozyma flocculosa]|uniref:Uncharacterized protein n=1 Tax=Pseudozyma flocculosa TaxID=84751 RepID=A0A5C3FCH8_9BASI|nr:uncharacterized protein PSFLO_06847 [Pseudozyma flocculosa]